MEHSEQTNEGDLTTKSLNPQKQNIIDLLLMLDDFMIVNVLLEMDPIQMMTFGATCKRFIALATDLKVWKQIIQRYGLMPALLRRKGGEKNCRRLRVMQKTYMTARLNEIEQQIAKVRYLPNLKRKAWEVLVNTFIILYKDQNTCRHLTVVYNVEKQIIKCPYCFTFSTNFGGPFHVKNQNLLTYMSVANLLSDQTVSISLDEE